jgi:hypothetical protein
LSKASSLADGFAVGESADVTFSYVRERRRQLGRPY